MPPSGFSQKAVKGALVFIQTCYEDLLGEVRSGKHENFESAIQFEIQQIGKALEKVHIDPQGNLIQKS